MSQKGHPQLTNSPTSPDYKFNFEDSTKYPPFASGSYSNPGNAWSLNYGILSCIPERQRYYTTCKGMPDQQGASELELILNPAFKNSSIKEISFDLAIPEYQTWLEYSGGRAVTRFAESYVYIGLESSNELPPNCASNPSSTRIDKEGSKVTFVYWRSSVTNFTNVKISCAEPFKKFRTTTLGSAGVGLVKSVSWDMPSISVKRARVAQVVYDPMLSGDPSSIVVVQGKPFGFEVFLERKNTVSLAGKSINIEVFHEDVSIAKTVNPIILPTSIDSSGVLIQANMLPIATINRASSSGLTFKVSFADGDALDTEDLYKNIKVVKTYAPRIGLVPFAGCNPILVYCYPNISSSDVAFFQNHASFIGKVFPFAQEPRIDQLSGSIVGDQRVEPQQGEKDNHESFWADVNKVGVLKVTQNRSLAGDEPLNRVFGVVPRGIFRLS